MKSGLSACEKRLYSCMLFFVYYYYSLFNKPTVSGRASKNLVPLEKDEDLHIQSLLLEKRLGKWEGGG